MHHQRRRRRAAAQPGGDALHLRLKGSRHDLHLDLRAASNLVAPGFMVQTLGKGGTTSVQVLPPEEFCFYQGYLRSQGNSSVALSTCQGLVSMHSCPRGVRCRCGRKRRGKIRNPGNIFTCSVTPGNIFCGLWQQVEIAKQFKILSNIPRSFLGSVEGSVPTLLSSKKGKP